MRKHRTIGLRSVDVIPVIIDNLLTTVYNRVKIAVPARYEVSNSKRVSEFKTSKIVMPLWQRVDGTWHDIPLVVVRI